MKTGKHDSTNDKQPLTNITATIARAAQPENAYLAWLPTEVLEKEIGQYLSLEDKFQLSQTSYRFNTLFKSDARQYSDHIHHFLTHVVRGEKKEVEPYLLRNPRLLLEKMKVTDEAGRKIVGTAYQIALGAKDVSLCPSEYEEMAEMLARYFKKLPNGEEEIAKQYAQQFPKGFEIEEVKRGRQDSAALNAVFVTIKDKTKAEVKDDVLAFKEYLKKSTERVIHTGYHFNEALFQEALALYAKHFKISGGFGSGKNKLVVKYVLGGIQRYFPANLAQAACDGFGKMVVIDKMKKPLSRSKLLEDKQTTFYSEALGVDHFVFSFWRISRGKTCGEGFGHIVPGAVEPGPCFAKIMSNKNNSLGKQMPQQKKPSCVIS